MSFDPWGVLSAAWRALCGACGIGAIVAFVGLLALGAELQRRKAGRRA